MVAACQIILKHAKKKVNIAARMPSKEATARRLHTVVVLVVVLMLMVVLLMLMLIVLC